MIFLWFSYDIPNIGPDFFGGSPVIPIPSLRIPMIFRFSYPTSRSIFSVPGPMHDSTTVPDSPWSWAWPGSLIGLNSPNFLGLFRWGKRPCVTRIFFRWTTHEKNQAEVHLPIHINRRHLFAGKASICRGWSYHKWNSLMPGDRLWECNK